MSTAARFVSVLLQPFCPSLQVSVFKVPVLKGEPLLLPLAPFLVVEVNVSALEKEQSEKDDHSEAQPSSFLTGRTESPYLFELVSDSLGLLVPLEPHHVLGVKPPRLFFQSLG